MQVDQQMNEQNNGIQAPAVVPSDQIDTMCAQIAESMERIRFTVENTDFTTFDENEDDDLIPSIRQAQQYKLPNNPNL